MNSNEVSTSLGPILYYRSEDLWEIDLSNLRIFFGLSILSRTIGEEIGNQLQSLPGDLSYLHKINPSINHELVDMHIQYIQVYARAGVLKDWVLYREQFEEDLRSVFGSFQQQTLAKKIHPEFYGENPNLLPSLALLFSFEKGTFHSDGYLILLERVQSPSQIGDFFLRVTIDSKNGSLNLKNIPHELVQEHKTRTYIAGSSKISESLSNGILNAAQKGETFFEEENSHFSRVFSQIEKTPIGKLTNINFYWEESYRNLILSSETALSLGILKKLFLLLEDYNVASKIKSGATIIAKMGKVNVYVDLSRLDRVLNFSFNQKRIHRDSTFYINRMPALDVISKKENHNFDFSKVHIFLIHHITSEIISLIECFRRLEVKTLDVAFVKYGGNIPPVYLDILLDIPTDFFFMAGLEFKLTSQNKPYYGVSPLYSDFSQHQKFKESLEGKKLGFFDAMRFLAVYLFLHKLAKLYSAGEKLLLIEDGGYVAPVLNELCFLKRDFASVLQEYGISSTNVSDANLPFEDILGKVLIGSVEHTRNGYDRLVKVKESFGGLKIPAFSIAVSNEKTKEESKEVARSILNAIQNTLQGLGKVLSKRKILILGSAGNIGSYLVKYLKHGFLNEDNQLVIEVDLKNSSNGSTIFSNFASVPNDIFNQVDLILGVTGDSVLKRKDWENWILTGTQQSIYLASGSTKTVEFSDFISLTSELNTSDAPSIQGKSISIHFDRILDPQTQMELGSKISFEILDQKIKKEVYLISDGSPVNFLFFGVPTESMDPIISQLASVSLGMVDLFQKQSLYPPDLYAVDRQIDIWGKKL